MVSGNPHLVGGTVTTKGLQDGLLFDGLGVDTACRWSEELGR